MSELVANGGRKNASMRFHGVMANAPKRAIFEIAQNLNSNHATALPGISCSLFGDVVIRRWCFIRLLSRPRGRAHYPETGLPSCLDSPGLTRAAGGQGTLQAGKLLN